MPAEPSSREVRSPARSGRALRRRFLWGLSGALLAAVLAAGSVGARAAGTTGGTGTADAAAGGERRPNFIIVFTDDQRWDSIGAIGNPYYRTPHLDRFVREGLHFPNAFVTLAICSPSRAALLTGRYGSANGVIDVEGASLKSTERTLAQLLKSAGYATGITGKWHLKNSPESLGFDFSFHCAGVTQFWNTPFTSGGEKVATTGFVEDTIVDAAVRFLDARAPEEPFLLWVNSFAPHMEANFSWSPKAESLYAQRLDEAPVPASWQDGLAGKPPYLQQDRSRRQALLYGYDDPAAIRVHAREYAASVTDMDAAFGRLMQEVERRGLAGNTYVIFMSDNGWFLGEHGLTSKVLAYEESMRVPFLMRGPSVPQGENRNLVLNVDILPTVLELAGIAVPENVHGASLLRCLDDASGRRLREAVLYEAMRSNSKTVHTVWPHCAVRTHDWKYIVTYDPKDRERVAFEELYDLRADPGERTNRMEDPGAGAALARMRELLARERERIAGAGN